jgi:hypothetical protein
MQRSLAQPGSGADAGIISWWPRRRPGRTVGWGCLLQQLFGGYSLLILISTGLIAHKWG